jgi:hypothetical protein
MFRACTVATIRAAGSAIAACSTDQAPTAPETGSAPYFVAIGLTASAAVETCRGGDPELGALSSDRTDLWISCRRINVN